MHENLVRRFAEAGLTLVFSDRPIVIGLRGQGDEVVQVDIQRKTNGSRRQEWFRIYPGAKTNRVEVVGTDKKYGQVVLMVHEPVREFIEPLSYTAISGIDFGDPSWRQVLASRVNARAQNLTPVYRKGRVVSVSAIRKTPDRKRHMLMGLDERQLFIAELPRGVSTVMGAHRILKGGDVTLAEGSGIKTVRQGEWFFLEASEEENRRIEEGLTKNWLILERDVPIGPFTDASNRGLGGRRRVRQFRGNPHTADELVVIPGNVLEHGWAVRGREVFIRGHVRHVDHATVTFPKWVKVLRNAEANVGQEFGGWVD